MNVRQWIEAYSRCERMNTALVIEGPVASGKTIAVQLMQAIMPRDMATIENFDPKFTNTIAKLMTTRDTVVIDDLVTVDQLDLIKKFVVESEVAVETLGVGREVRTIKANMIITAQFFPTMVGERRFIRTTPVEMVALLIPFVSQLRENVKR